MNRELFNPKTAKKLCSKTGVTDSQKKAVEKWLKLLDEDKLNKSYIILVSLILIISSPLVHAKKSEEFIVYSSNVIFEDCKGNDIYLYNDWYHISSNGSETNVIQWPYDLSKVYMLFNAFVQREPYDRYLKGEGLSETRDHAMGTLNGEGTLKCGDNVLDINYLDYFWNDERLEVPRNINNIVLQNNGNLIQGLENCNNQQNQINAELNNCTLNLQETNTELNNCTIVLNETNTEVNNYKIILEKSEKENFWMSYIYPAFLTVILSIYSYLIIHPNSRKKERLKTTIVYLFGILVISLVVFYLFRSIVEYLV